MGQSSSEPWEEQNEIKRMANIIAGGRDMENITPAVNRIPTGLNNGATSEMRDALAQMPGSNSKADYLNKLNQATDIKLSGKKQIDNRTEWERNVDRAKELKNPNWKNDFISSKNFDRDGYMANLPRVVDGKLYSKSGKLWTDADWNWFHTKYGQPKHYNSEAKGV